ncbi:protein kinase, partial [Gemmatimonadota bacterium]
MIGRTVGHYKVIDKIGEGGMGAVWKAEDTSLGRLVALKTLAPHLSQDEEARQRFIREAQAASSLNHPNITTVYELVDDRDSHLICMEYIEGKTIRDMLEGGRVSVKKAVDITLQAAEALEVAHKKGILHRDIKSANIMVTLEGRVKVMDFGLAHLGERSQLTRTGTMMGTLAYTCPEQIAGKPVDARSEIWSLGAVFYELLAGQIPFNASNEAELIFSIINNEPPRLNQVRDDVGPLVESVVIRMLEKDPMLRYQSMGELSTDLAALRREMDTSTTSVIGALDRARIGRRQQLLARIAGLVTVVAAMILGISLITKKPETKVFVPKIVVSIIQNETGDPSLDHLKRQLTGSVTSYLAQVRIQDIEVEPYNLVSEISQELSSTKGSSTADYQIELLAKRTKASLIISGSFHQGSNETLSIRLNLHDIESAETRSFEIIRGRLDDIDHLVNTLADRIAGTLAWYTDIRFRFLTGNIQPPPSLEVYRAFKSGLETHSIPKLLEAAEIDSNYLTPLLWAADRTTSTWRDSLLGVLYLSRDVLPNLEQRYLEWLLLPRNATQERQYRVISGIETTPGSYWDYLAATEATDANLLSEAVDLYYQCLYTAIEKPEVNTFELTTPSQVLELPSIFLADLSWSLWELDRTEEAIEFIHFYQSQAYQSPFDSLYTGALEVMNYVMLGDMRSAWNLYDKMHMNRSMTGHHWWQVLYRDLVLVLRKFGHSDEIKRVFNDWEYHQKNVRPDYEQTTYSYQYYYAEALYLAGRFEEALPIFQMAVDEYHLWVEQYETSPAEYLTFWARRPGKLECQR